MPRLKDRDMSRKLSKQRGIRRSSLHLLKNTVSNKNTPQKRPNSQQSGNSMSTRKLRKSALLMRLNRKHTGKRSALRLRLRPDRQLWQQSLNSPKTLSMLLMNVSSTKKRRRSMIKLNMR